MTHPIGKGLKTTVTESIQGLNKWDFFQKNVEKVNGFGGRPLVDDKQKNLTERGGAHPLWNDYLTIFFQPFSSNKLASSVDALAISEI